MDDSITPELTVLAEREDHRIRIDCEYRDRDLVQTVPGASWDRKKRQWYTRLSWAACLQLRGVFGDRLTIGDDLHEWSAHEYRMRIEPCLRLRDAEDVDHPLLNGRQLYPRQRAGVAFLYTAQYAMLGDEVGAGKTRQVINALELRNAYPAVIICTKSAKESAWAEEFRLLKKTGDVPKDRKVVVVTGNAPQRRKQLSEPADVYIVHWQILRLHSRLAGYGYIKLEDKEKEEKELNVIPKRAVVADESHRMQDPKSKQTRAAWALFDEVKDAPDTMRLCLTGTPIESSMEEAWPQLRAVAQPEFPSKSKYIDRYALQTWSPFGFNEIAGVLPERKEEFFKIVDARFIRRPRRVVVPDVPEPLRAPPRIVELAGKQKKAYEQMRDGLLAEVDEGTIMAKNPLQQMTRLRQFAAAFAELEPDPRDPDKLQVRLSEPSVVIDELVDMLEGEYRDVPALVFAQSRQLIEIASRRLAKHDIKHGLITGMVKELDRAQAQRDFQAGKLKLCLMTTGAGGESLTFTAAKAEIFIERPFSLLANKQAEGRAPRPGQTDRVLMQDIIVKDTVYEDAYDAIARKEQSFEEFVRDADTIRRFLHPPEKKTKRKKT